MSLNGDKQASSVLSAAIAFPYTLYKGQEDFLTLGNKYRCLLRKDLTIGLLQVSMYTAIAQTRNINIEASSLLLKNNKHGEEILSI